jgi:hypothetical protein
VLVAHKIVDGLRGLKKFPLVPVVGVTDAVRAAAAKRILASEKFDFGHPPLEPDSDAVGSWMIPTLTDDEISWWRAGFIPLPAPLCWFELELGATRTGLMVEDDGTDWTVERFDLTDLGVICDGIARRVRKSGPGDGFVVNLTGAQETLGFYARFAGSIPQLSLGQLVADARLAVYLALMLNSRTTEKRAERAAGSPLSASRVRRGRAPLSDHLVVRIVPASYAPAFDPATGRAHRSPRLHWRRSHLRHYDRATPASKWSETIEHAGRRGWWVTVVPRSLVGREDLGEISHTYWVPPSQLESKGEAK